MPCEWSNQIYALTDNKQQSGQPPVPENMSFIAGITQKCLDGQSAVQIGTCSRAKNVKRV